jgi:peptidyl-prolyl cis-trans isomerase C
LSRLSLNDKSWFIPLLLAAALLAAMGCDPASPTANVESEAKKVAVFEGGEVTLGEVQQFAEQAGLGEVTADSPQFEAVIPQVMLQLVDIEVAKAYAEENGITVSDRDVDREIEEIKDQLFEQVQEEGQDLGREEAFEQALEQNGITEQQLREQLREQLPVQKVQERVAGDAEPSEQEVETFYEENRESQFTTPERRCARHILFNEDQEEKADDVKRELEDGAEFAQLAEENSQDPGSAENGGDLGCLGRGETVPNFEEALFDAEEGEILGPVETQFGYHIIEVTEIQQSSTQPLEDVEGEIRSQLASELQAEEFATWVQEQKKERNVKYLPGYEPPA